MSNLTIIIALVAGVVALIAAFIAQKAAAYARMNLQLDAIFRLFRNFESEKFLKSSRVVQKLHQQITSDPHYSGTNAVPIILKYLTPSNRDAKEKEWTALQDMMGFWRKVGISLENGYIDENLAFSAFSSPELLDFLTYAAIAYSKVFDIAQPRSDIIQRLNTRYQGLKH
ncbi:hypothetical protein JXJ21_10915 [candidate division KSB1 bacterium]|nr:hypothetical protein [candidate division KSB1 bacterium]